MDMDDIIKERLYEVLSQVEAANETYNTLWNNGVGRMVNKVYASAGNYRKRMIVCVDLLARAADNSMIT